MKEMILGSAGLSIIKFYETFQDKAYNDGVDVITIGYGTTVYSNGTKVKLGDTISLEKAESELFHHIQHEICLKLFNIINVDISQNKFDSIVSLVYNIGITAFSKSTLLKKLNSNLIDDAAKQFDVWNMAGGKKSSGLVKRRKTEKNLFLEEKPVKKVNIDANREFVSFEYEESNETCVEINDKPENIQTQPILTEPRPQPSSARPWFKLW